MFDWISPSLYKELSEYSDDKMLDTFSQAFNLSVDEHMVSDSRLGSMFSAGVDSSLITAIASRHKKISC